MLCNQGPPALEHGAEALGREALLYWLWMGKGRANRALAYGCLQHVVLGSGASPWLPAAPPWLGWHWYRAVGCYIALALLSLSTLVFQLMHKLSVEAPPKILVERYLIEIAKNYNVPYEPDSVVMVSQPQDVALQ